MCKRSDEVECTSAIEILRQVTKILGGQYMRSLTVLYIVVSLRY